MKGYEVMRSNSACLTVLFIICCGWFLLQLSAASRAQESSAIYIIYDSSNSMWGELEDKSRKYETGRKAVRKFLNGDFSNKLLALRAYGHRRAGDCRDSELVIPFQKAGDAKDQIADAVDEVKPTGKTPIDYSLREALKDFGERRGDILLISDGIETCDADPCALMNEWKNSDINIRVHVVGFGVKRIERGALACIAENSGGQYFDANSADELRDVLEKAREVVVVEESELVVVEPEPTEDQFQGYALKITAIDDQGRKYKASGKLFKDGTEIGKVASYRRNELEEAGSYEIEIGPVLEDGSLFKPVRQAVEINKKGDTKIEVMVETPAFVRAKFIEDGEPHRGSFVRVYQNNKQVFGFRPKQEALARSGTYEFRATPNKDNPISVTQTLSEGELAIVEFDLATTVKFHIVYKLPDGETVKRNSELWRDGKKVYGVHSRNGVLAKPGTYLLKSDSRESPLEPSEITIPATDGTILEVPLNVGFLHISYPESEHYTSKPNRAKITALDRKSGPRSNISKPIPVTPGRYKIEGWTAAGYFDPQEVVVEQDKTTSVVLVPKPLGTIVMTYAPSEQYTKEPDRASITSLDGQPKNFGILRPGRAQKLLPGKYLVEGWSAAGDIEPQEVDVVAGETLNIELRLR